MGDEYILSGDVGKPLNPKKCDFDCVLFVCHKDTKSQILFLLLPIRGIERVATNSRIFLVEFSVCSPLIQERGRG